MDGEMYIPMYNNSALLTSNACFKWVKWPYKE